MNWLDIVIIVVSVIVGYMGLKSGLIKMVSVVVGFIAGFWLAGQYGDQVASMFGDASWASVAAFAIILIVALIAFSMIGSILRKILSLVMLGWADKLVGGVLGLALGAFICAALLMFIVNATFDIPNIPGVQIPNLNFMQKAIKDSTLAKLLIQQMPILMAFVPAEFRNKIPSFFR